MLILGIETSCDETGIALYEAGTAAMAGKLLAHGVSTLIVLGTQK